MSSLCAASSGARLLGSESIAQPRSAVPKTTSTATGRIAFVAVRVTFGCSGVESGSSLHHARDVRDGFDAAKRQNDADEGYPGVPKIRVRRSNLQRTEMGCAQEDDRSHHDHGGNRQPDRDAATMFRSEIIDGADGEDQSHRGDRGILAWDAQVTDRGPAAQRRGDNEIGDEQKRAGGGEEPALLPRRGVDAAAIGKMGADDDVVVGHHRGQHADRENDRQRRKAGGDESEADDIGLARAPVAVEQGGGALPIDIARADERRWDR